MKFSHKLLVIILFLSTIKVNSEEYLYILNEECINNLYNKATAFFKKTPIETIKDSRGIILRYIFDDAYKEFQELNLEIYKSFEYFLAKIENPAIIEVHIENFPKKEGLNLKKWEISTIMANEIEAIITLPVGSVKQEQINSIGYGEFLPAKNTSNNGGKNINRVDIIVLCNISGE